MWYSKRLKAVSGVDAYAVEIARAWLGAVQIFRLRVADVVATDKGAEMLALVEGLLHIKMDGIPLIADLETASGIAHYDSGTYFQGADQVRKSQ
ncbi:MAG: hypothetical protein M3H12_18695 [Chromatiales bacterium]|nr:hypothetical protein [Gammaproteobacteria bacterium]